MPDCPLKDVKEQNSEELKKAYGKLFNEKCAIESELDSYKEDAYKYRDLCR